MKPLFGNQFSMQENFLTLTCITGQRPLPEIPPCTWQANHAKKLPKPS